MTLWKIFAVDTQFKQLRKRSLKKKKFRLQRDSNPWPPRHRCSALSTELWSHNCWEQVNFSGSIRPLRAIQHHSDWVCTAVQTQSLWCCIALSGLMDPLKLTCSQQLWLHSSVDRALHRCRGGHGFESRWSLNFFFFSGFSFAIA